MILIGLHGFLGRPSDFDKLLSHLNTDQFWAPNLFELGPLDPTHSFQSWVENLVGEMDQVFGKDRPKPVLIGYSQGARLALHAAYLRGDLFERVILLSGHPGQLNPQEARQRREWVRQWSEVFRNEPWSDVMKKWNAQPVFQGSREAERRAEDFHQGLLVQALENWALYNHLPDWRALETLSPAPLWVFGERDEKFQGVQKQLKNHGLGSQIMQISEAGHRLLQDNVAELAAAILQWIRTA